MFWYLSSITAIMVRIQFAYDLNLYLAMYTPPYENEELPIFVPTSLSHMRSIINYCGKASIRRIDDNVYEFYFCGMKLGYDEKSNELRACEEDEFNTKWEFTKVDSGTTFILRNNGYCITLADKRVVMRPCHEGVDLKQIVHVFPEYIKSKFFVTDDESKKDRIRKFNKSLKDNEDVFRMESIEKASEYK